MNKRFIIISGIALLISIGLLIIAYLMPSEKVIANCINITPLSDKQILPKNMELAQKNYETCKVSLAENDKKFKDTSWKALSTEALYGEKGQKPYVDSIDKFLVIKDSLTILDSMVNNGNVLAKFKAEINHDELGANRIFDEMRVTVGEYVSYEQETKTLEKIEALRAALLKKYFNK